MNNATPEKFANLCGITLVPRGFLIPKAPQQNQWFLQRAIADLTFKKPEKRFGGAAGANRNFYAKREPPIRVFIDGADYMLVPKQWGLRMLRGTAVKISNQNEDGEEINVDYRSDMPLFEDERRPQQSAVRFALEHLQKNGAALIEMPVGTGKTNVALKVMAECGVKTLWLAHRHNLLEQCAERAAEFLPGVRIGWLYADRIEIQNKDLVLGMVQTLESKTTFDPAIFRQFGLVILDEAHHAAARSFVDALFIVAAPRMLAVTACAKRKDGLDDITHLFFSEDKFIVKPTLPPGLKLHIRSFCVHQRSHVLEPDLCDAMHAKKVQKALAAAGGDAALVRAKLDSKPDNISDGGYSVLCSELARIAPLNALAAALVKRALITTDAAHYGDISAAEMQDCAFSNLHDRERSTVLVHMRDTNEKVAYESVFSETERVRRSMQQCERQVFVACAHKSMVDSLQKRIVRSGVPEHMIGTYYGDLKASERGAALRKRVVLVTYSMAEEGLDVPTANTLVIKQARGSSALQTVGRVLRDKMSAAVEPLVLDCYSAWCAMDEGMYWQRQTEFKKYPHQSATFHIGKKKNQTKDGEHASLQTVRPISSYFTSNADTASTSTSTLVANEIVHIVDARVDLPGAISQAARIQAKKATAVDANGKPLLEKKSKKRSAVEKEDARQIRAAAKRRRDLNHVAYSAANASIDLSSQPAPEDEFPKGDDIVDDEQDENAIENDFPDECGEEE